MNSFPPRQLPSLTPPIGSPFDAIPPHSLIIPPHSLMERRGHPSPSADTYTRPTGAEKRFQPSFKIQPAPPPIKGSYQPRVPVRDLYVAYQNFLITNNPDATAFDHTTLTLSIFDACYGEFLSHSQTIPPFRTTEAAEKHRSRQVTALMNALHSKMNAYQRENDSRHIAGMKVIYLNLGMSFTKKTPEELKANLFPQISRILDLLTQNEIALISDTLRLIYLAEVT